MGEEMVMIIFLATDKNEEEEYLQQKWANTFPVFGFASEWRDANCNSQFSPSPSLNSPPH
jgi:hypothetical protein